MTSALPATARWSGSQPSETGPATRFHREPGSRFVAGIQNTLIAVLLVAFIAIGWRARPPLGLGGTDEMVYWALSKSLESGSYREIYQASAPRHLQYPPVYPAWLVVVRHTLGDRIELVPAANLALVAGALLLLTLVARQLMGGWA